MRHNIRDGRRISKNIGTEARKGINLAILKNSCDSPHMPPRNLLPSLIPSGSIIKKSRINMTMLLSNALIESSILRPSYFQCTLFTKEASPSIIALLHYLGTLQAHRTLRHRQILNLIYFLFPSRNRKINK